jgi:hypothetical protein
MFCAFVAAFGLAAAAQAQFDLSWHTIDGGGAMFSTGGTFSLGGTIGQPDAGAVMTGGTFTLTGGFWAGAVDSGCTLIGDITHDNAVGLSDLTILLSNYGTLTGATPDQGNLDGDGDVDINDLTLLLAHFGETCP